MKSLAARQIIKILEANGFTIARQRGSHIIFRNVTTGQIVPVPLHGGNKILPIGTFLAIVKQSGLNPEEFKKK
jgi:predicted RNA binding protein YcfA (HicA-like mRNA interferase family)